MKTAFGSELVGLTYVGPFDHLPAARDHHRVIAWDDASLDEGTGIVHIVPGAGTEDFELSKVHDLPMLVPVDESGHFYDDYGWLHGLGTVESADQILADLVFRTERGTPVNPNHASRAFARLAASAGVAAHPPPAAPCPGLSDGGQQGAGQYHRRPAAPRRRRCPRPAGVHPSATADRAPAG